MKRRGFLQALLGLPAAAVAAKALPADAGQAVSRSKRHRSRLFRPRTFRTDTRLPPKWLQEEANKLANARIRSVQLAMKPYRP